MRAATCEPRVALRPMEAAGVQGWPWLAEAVVAVGGGRMAQGANADGEEGLGPNLRETWPSTSIDIIMVSAEEIGFVAWRREEGVDSGSGCDLIITALSVRVDRRNLGYGAEAVEALEERVGARRAYAAVPRANGLALYFWLHTGYRPVRMDESAMRARDPACLWMVRHRAD